MDHSKHVRLDSSELIPSVIEGATIYGAGDHKVGTVSHMHGTGSDSEVIIDVGGFLGVGEKPVAVGMDNLTFMADEDGDQYLYTTFTKEQLDAAPAYDESTYAEKRDEQRIIMEN